MKKILKSLPIYLIPFLGLFFFSCIDDPVDADGNNVNVKIYESNGYPMKGFHERYYVSPGNYPITEITGTTQFSINSLSTPYNFVITQLFGNFTLKLTGIRSNNLNIIYDDLLPGSYSLDEFFFYVDLPADDEEEPVYFYKFITDKPNIQVNSFFTLHTGDSIGSCKLLVPFHSQNDFISGSLIVFKAENYFSGTNIDFKNYGIKTIDSLYYGGIITFEKEELAADIPETMTEFTNLVPEGRFGNNSSVSISFLPLNRSNDLIIYDHIPDEVSLAIPVIPLEHKIKFKGVYRGSSLLFEDPFKYIYLDPGVNGTITHAEPVFITSPPDNDSNINSSTVFSVNDNRNGGVYLFQFIQYSRNYRSRILRIYTEKKDLTFDDVFCRGFEYRSNSYCYWNVYKFPEFSGIDEFTSQPYVNSSKYNSLQSSESRTFILR